MDPLNPDSISVEINSQVFKDPIKGIMIDISEPFEQKLPRQLDPGFA